jgi:OOP family OmpA-OmpF porin
MKVDIEGHTDWVGADAYNLRLSQRRAQAVVNWLVAHGISRDRMRAVGKGEREPIATNTTAAGRQLNRRTEVRRWD